MLCCPHEIIPFEGYIRSLSSVFTKLVMTRMKGMGLAHTYGSTRFCAHYVLLSRLYTRALYPSKMIVRVVVYILIQSIGKLVSGEFDIVAFSQLSNSKTQMLPKLLRLYGSKSERKKHLLNKLLQDNANEQNACTVDLKHTVSVKRGFC